MKEKRDCKIVQDLLPNYIEKLTNEETNKYIEEHLIECDDCKQVLKEMKNEVSLDEAKRDNREVNFIKKFNIKFKLLKNILLVIIVLFVIVTGRKMFILTSMSNKASKIEQDNYYLKVTSYSPEGTNNIEYYVKDGEFLGKLVTYNLKNDNVYKIVDYTTEEESIRLLDSKESGYNGFVMDSSNEVMLPISFTSKNVLVNLCIALTTSIDRVKIDEKDCYIIKDGNTQKFIEIDTGLAIKMFDIQNNRTADYHYEYGVVKDSDIVRPDTTGYLEV